MKRKYPYLIFFGIPFLVFLLLIIALRDITRFYYGWFDPGYAYLMNGLTFATGSLDIGHTDHPGTSLQLICALIIKITGFIRGADDLPTDVITNAELYLHVISLTIGIKDS